MAVTEETTKAPIVDVIEYERGEPTEGKIDPITEIGRASCRERVL